MTGEQEETREVGPMSDTGLAQERAMVDPVAVGPGGPETDGTTDAHPASAGLSASDASLLGLIDRLNALLERSDLGELEVSSGDTTIILRAPSAIAAAVAVAAPSTEVVPAGASGGTAPATDGESPAAAPVPGPAARPSVKAPLTGIYYGAPSPGATPYVSVGDHVAVGQIIGLIEAMKLFNEIKSDLAGRVTRLCSENGALVKAKQPLIEVEPA